MNLNQALLLAVEVKSGAPRCWQPSSTCEIQRDLTFWPILPAQREKISARQFELVIDALTVVLQRQETSLVNASNDCLYLTNFLQGRVSHAGRDPRSFIYEKMLPTTGGVGVAHASILRYGAKCTHGVKWGNLRLHQFVGEQVWLYNLVRY